MKNEYQELLSSLYEEMMRAVAGENTSGELYSLAANAIMHLETQNAVLSSELDAVKNSEMNAEMNLELVQQENYALRGRLKAKELELQILRNIVNSGKE